MGAGAGTVLEVIRENPLCSQQHESDEDPGCTENY